MILELSEIGRSLAQAAGSALDFFFLNLLFNGCSQFYLACNWAKLTVQLQLKRERTG
jgi:hypothetical protein